MSRTEELSDTELIPAFHPELQSPLWNGNWCQLEQGRTVNMPQTSNSAMTFVAFTYEKDIGSVRLVSGAHRVGELEVNGTLNAPVPVLHNFHGENLAVTNTSNTGIPIWIAAYRFGFNHPQHLGNDGTPVLLPPFFSTQGNARASFQELIISSPGNYAVFTVMFGGRAFIYAVNAPGDLPDGYTKTTPGNTIKISRDFLGAEIYVANLSPYKSGEGTVRLV